MANHYVDTAADAGGDGTTDALTGPNCAWDTIADVNAHAFVDDDFCLFKRGCMWRETLTIPSSGTAGHPITFGAYGTGADPIINGADLIVGWSDSGSDVWEAALTTQPTQVYFNGTRGTLVASEAACTSAGKWFWASNILYVYSTSDPDTAFTTPGIEASIRINTIHTNAKNYVTIQYIQAIYSNSTASATGSVYGYYSTALIFDGLTIHDNDGYGGIYIAGTTNVNTIKNCVVSYTRHAEVDRGDGILFHSSGTGHIVQDCTVHHSTGAGIKEKISDRISEAMLIHGNTVYQCGSAGISINGDGTGPSDYIIEHNIVYEFGLTEDDYFGIDLFKCGDDNIICYNLIHDDNYIAVSSGGIRLDSNPGHAFGTGTQIYYNIIYNVRDGVQITPPFNSLYNNVIYNIEETAILINDDFVTAGAVKNNITHAVTGKHVRNDDATNVVYDYNCYYGGAANWYYEANCTFAEWKVACGGDSHSINADPLFVNAAGHDFHLLSTSPCINTGVDVGLTEDFEGNPIE